MPRNLAHVQDFACGSPYYSLFAQIKSLKIHDDRVILLGDANYTTPDTNFSLVIIDDYVLAGELLSYLGDVKTALKRYEGILLPFAKSQQSEDNNAMQLLNPQTPWGISIRNAILDLVTWIGWRSRQLRR